MQLPEFIKRDWSRKLVAVVMAGIIWVTVHQQFAGNLDPPRRHRARHNLARPDHA